MDPQKIFSDIINKRRSVRRFDKNKEFDSNIIRKSIEQATLSANSSNMQLWEFYQIKSPRILKQMIPICLNQSAAKSAQEFVVFVCRPDLWKKRQLFHLSLLSEKKTSLENKKQYKDYYGRLIPCLYQNDPLGVLGFFRKIYVQIIGLFKPTYRQVSKSDLTSILHKSCALSAQTFMLSIASKGYASCPMEGFDSVRLLKLLDLPKKALINMVIAVGHEDPKGIWGERTRVPNKEVIFQI